MALVNYDRSDESSDSEEEHEPKVSNLSQKPVPPNSSAQFTDAVEAEYKMRIPKNAKPLLKPLNIEKRTSKSGKVLITIQSLEELDSSDDSDDETQLKHQKAREDEDEFVVEEDGDTEQGNGESKYFSFYDAKEEAKRLEVLAQSTVMAPSTVPTSSTTAPPNANVPSSAPPGLPVLPEKPFSDEDLPEPGQKPAEHSAKESNQYENAEEPEPVWTEASFIPAPERKRARLGGCGQLQIGAGSSAVMDVIASANSEIRSVSQDELTDGAELELLKSITSDNRPKKVEAEAPNKLAFRKHQITWLAYKAQEQEYELQEQWSEARRNQFRSRSKYGF
ncbi:unnamed protein product [Dibothriocephalus latus]|uniref:Uncharacterized protein n=1 Tax=Dibothriocephalus latus TaxID=60516 RepID=A0A3P6UZX8_DIBLA|nr:unnamed protein product [Dibothriocephalus latus]